MSTCKTLLAALAISITLGCAREKVPEEQAATSEHEFSRPEKIAAQHLPNAFRVHGKVISGGLPEGEEAFAELQALGVKTIISVDGAKPDVETARKFGLRYIHMPHGYDGIPDERALALAKAVRDLPGPVYIHCHHGKHRSPAAAAVACVGAGMIDNDAALRVLETAGTSPSYRGLYESASSTRWIDKEKLDALQVDYPENAQLPELAEAMVALEHTHDHLKQLAANAWQPIPAQPDLDSAHEALLLREHFTELLRSEETRSQPQYFQDLLSDSEAAAQELECELDAWSKAGKQQDAPEATRKALQRVTSNCAACHQKFRDVPLSEKEK